MWWGPKHSIFHLIPSHEVKSRSRYQSYISKSGTAPAFQLMSVTFFITTFNIFAVSSGIAFTSCTRHGSALSPLYHSGKEVVPLVKSEKIEVSTKPFEGRLHDSLIPTPKDLLGSRSILLGSPIHLSHHFLNHLYPPKAYKIRLISMVEREKSYVVALTF